MWPLCFRIYLLITLDSLSTTDLWTIIRWSKVRSQVSAEFKDSEAWKEWGTKEWQEVEWREGKRNDTKRRWTMEGKDHKPEQHTQLGSNHHGCSGRSGLHPISGTEAKVSGDRSFRKCSNCWCCISFSFCMHCFNHIAYKSIFHSTFLTSFNFISKRPSFV